LRARPSRTFSRRSSLSLDERLSIGEQILRALAAVHAHDFVHGDLSPLNVLVTASRDVRLIDVGYGALFDASADVALSTTKRGPARGGVAAVFRAGAVQAGGGRLREALGCLLVSASCSIT